MGGARTLVSPLVELRVGPVDEVLEGVAFLELREPDRDRSLLVLREIGVHFGESASHLLDLQVGKPTGELVTAESNDEVVGT